MGEHVEVPVLSSGNACNCISTLNNGLPTQVEILLGPNVSKNELTTAAGFVDETWRLGRLITVSLGMRLDRYDHWGPASSGSAPVWNGSVTTVRP